MIGWLGTLMACSALASSPVRIVEDRKPAAVIVLAAEPSESARKAAEELQHYIERMTGAKLPIAQGSGQVPEPLRGGPRLLVGRSPELASHKLTIPSGDNADRSGEGFVLKTVGKDIVIAGNETPPYQGTLYAAYELLEQLGCRWYFPGAFGEVVPTSSTLEVPALDLRQTPSFIIRNIWMSGWADRTGDHDPWLVRNKGSGRALFAFPGDGSIHRLVPPAKYAESHPEIYAMGRDGKRQPFGPNNNLEQCMIDVAEPKALEIAAEEVKAYFRAHPNERSFAFAAPDGNPQSFSPAAIAANHDFKTDSGQFDSISDSYFNFVNNLAHEVAKEFPDRHIVTLAYANRVTPPEGLDRPWNPNTLIYLARLRIDTTKPIGDPTHYMSMRHKRTLDAWNRTGSKLVIYDYDPHADLSRMPFWLSGTIQSNMRLYHRSNVIGFTTEGHNTFLRTGLNYYLRAKLMWDVNADVAALKADFYTKFFGPASQPMAKFIDTIEHMMASSRDRVSWTNTPQDWSQVYPRDQTAALRVMLDEAEKLATSEPFRTRVSAYRAIHDYMMNWHETVGLLHAGMYAEARQSVEKWDDPIRRVEDIQPGLLPPDPQWVLGENRSVNAWRGFLDALLHRTDGTLGRRLGLAPESGQFRTDPKNVGLFEQWHVEEVASAKKWDTIPLTRDWTTSGYADEDGYGYDGIAWYRIAIDIPANVDPANGRIGLVSPTVFATHLWIWCNGQLVHSPTHPDSRTALHGSRVGVLDVDVTRHIRPGKPNIFTYRMYGTYDRVEHRGLRGRPMVWQAAGEPKLQTPATPTQ